MSDLPTYDPHWERRWRRAKAIVETLPQSEWEIRYTAIREMQRAHEAQFRTSADLADFHFGLLRQSAALAGFMLAIRPLGPEATCSDVYRVWCEAEAVLAASKRAAARPPRAQPPGLTAFAVEGEAHVMRLAQTLEYAPRGRAPQTWTVVIERRRSGVHMCLVARDRGQSVFDDFAKLASAAYRRLLTPPRWRPWGGVRPEEVQVYSYIPWALQDTGEEHLYARHLSWLRGRYLEDVSKRRSFATVPLRLAELDPAPTKSKSVLVFANPPAARDSRGA